MKYLCGKIDKRKILKVKPKEGSGALWEAFTDSLAAQFGQDYEDFKEMSSQCRHWYTHYWWSENTQKDFEHEFAKKNRLGKSEREGVAFELLNIGPTLKEETMCNCPAEVGK